MPTVFQQTVGELPNCARSEALFIDQVAGSPTNPRKTFPEAKHLEMVKSVKRHGVMQPILVRPWPERYPTPAGYAVRPFYEIVAGERRYRAARDAGQSVIPGLVRDLTDREVLELQVIENLHREDLHPLEEAESYELMMKEYGYTADELAEKIEKSKAYIYARLKLTALCPAGRQAFREGTLDASRALLIARIPGAALQEQAIKTITEGWDGPMSYRDAAHHVQVRYMLKLPEAPFLRSDENLVPAAGACQDCPKRTGNSPELFPDVKSADVCTDPDCYAAKKTAHFARKKSAAKAQGRPMIEGEAARKIMPDRHSLRGYKKLDDKCWDAPAQDGKHPTYRDLLTHTTAQIVLIEDPDGDLVEAIKESEFKAATAEAGLKIPPSHKDEEKEREAKAKLETAFRRRLHGQIRTAFQEDVAEHGAQLEQDDMILIARQFLACTWHENQKHLARLWVRAEEKLDDHERIRRMTSMIDTLEPAQLLLLLIDLSLISMTHVGSYQVTDTPEPLLFTARRLGVSADTLRREIQAEAGSKKKRTPPQLSPAEPPPTPSKAPLGEEGGSGEGKPGDLNPGEDETTATDSDRRE